MRICPCGYTDECSVNCGTGHTTGECPKWKPRTCIVYRTAAKALKSNLEQTNYNNSDEPQFEACEFTDGRVAQRWLTSSRSSVWWDSWEELCKVHIYAHPNYGTRIEWSNNTVEEL